MEFFKSEGHKALAQAAQGGDEVTVPEVFLGKG